MNYKELILKQMRNDGLTLGLAESATGGMLSSTLVDVKGASRVLKGSVVAYTKEAKMSLLDVNEETLEKHTSYSANVAREMALGIRRKLNVEVAIAVTGIADLENLDKEAETIELEAGKCKIFFCIILIDKIYDFEMLIPDEGRNINRITITSKIIEELFKLTYNPNNKNV